MLGAQVASKVTAEPIRLATYLFGAASIGAGVLDLVWGEFEAAHQPIGALGDHVPGQVFLAYIAAALLIAGALPSSYGELLALVPLPWGLCIWSSPFSGCRGFTQRHTRLAFAFPLSSALSAEFSCN